MFPHGFKGVNVNRLQDAIPGPRCPHCDRPKMTCYTDPCEATLNRVADGLIDKYRDGMARDAEPPRMVLTVPQSLTVEERNQLRASWKKLDTDSQPLVIGGQGRTRAEVLDYCHAIVAVVLVLLTVVAWILWRVWL